MKKPPSKKGGNNKYLLLFLFVGALLLIAFFLFPYIRNESSVNNDEAENLNANYSKQQVSSFLDKEMEFRLQEKSVKFPARATGVSISNDGSKTITIDNATFERFASENFQVVEQAAQSAQIHYNQEKGAFETVKEKEGLTLNKEKLKNDIVSRTRILSENPIILKTIPANPKIYRNDLAEIRLIAQNIVDSPPTLVAEETTWKIEKEALASWIIFKINEEALRSPKEAIAFSSEKIEEYLKEIRNDIDRPAQNGRFIFRDGSIQTITSEKRGRSIKIKESARLILDGLNKKQSLIVLSFDQINPKITAASLTNYGITTLIGKGESNFSGSPASRVHNIKTSLRNYQGIILAPGEEFSFNKLLGEVNRESGYEPELVIKGSKILKEYGGGICQVSTTIFRAAVNSGLQITSRKNHSYVVGYYGKPGFDATIYLPDLDLRFKNTANGYILIQNSIKGTVLGFEIYGKPTNQKVLIEGPVPYDIEESGALKTWLKQIVKDENNNIIREQLFESRYKSKENIIYVDENIGAQEVDEEPEAQTGAEENQPAPESEQNIRTTQTEQN